MVATIPTVFALGGKMMSIGAVLWVRSSWGYIVMGTGANLSGMPPWNRPQTTQHSLNRAGSGRV